MFSSTPPINSLNILQNKEMIKMKDQIHWTGEKKFSDANQMWMAALNNHKTMIFHYTRI